MKQGFQNSEQARQVLAFHCPRWAQLPGIELYMDQVTGYINEIFAPLCPTPEEKMLTKAMVNNYVKQRVMGPPLNKKYGKAHVAYLVAICALKQVFSIPETAQLIQTQIEHCPVEQAYDYFCEQLERALRLAIEGGPAQNLPQDDGALLVVRVTQAYADKVYIQKRLAYEAQGQAPGRP